MKKRTLLTCGLAAALFAGCSSDDKLTVDDGTVPNGTGYVSLRIALPSTSGGMRADNQANDQHDKGDANEYKVNDITLIFFDDNNKYVETHKLTNAGSWSTAPGTATGITTDYTIPAQQVSENVKKVLVLLNTPTGINTSPNSFEAFNSALTADVKDLTGDGKNDFFMSNTTIAIAGEDPMTLVPVETKNTAAEAVAAAHTIHVERAVGKVSISHAADDWSTWTYTIPTSSTVHPGDKIEIKNWVLDNTNTQYYPVRKFNKAWGTLETAASTPINPNRFQSYNADYVAYTSAGAATFGYRTYWAEDPNYDQDATLTQFGATYGDEGIEQIDQDLSTDLYCLENTFDVKHMKQQNTTCAVLKAQYTPKGFTPNTDWYLIGNSTIPRTKAQVIAAANEAIADANPVTDVTFNNGKNTSFNTTNLLGANETQASTIASYLGSVTKYTKGYCYYIVRIQHFGSYVNPGLGYIYTPWGGEQYSWGSTTDEKYVDYTTSSDPYLEGKYLGRYGIVRNNWYELELGTISGPGDPEKPSSTTNPDDSKKTYISATVKIMDWAVRKQSVNL